MQNLQTLNNCPQVHFGIVSAGPQEKSQSACSATQSEGVCSCSCPSTSDNFSVFRFAINPLLQRPAEKKQKPRRLDSWDLMHFSHTNKRFECANGFTAVD